jgi:hypothetical protein
LDKVVEADPTFADESGARLQPSKAAVR